MKKYHYMVIAACMIMLAACTGNKEKASSAVSQDIEINTSQVKGELVYALEDSGCYAYIKYEIDWPQSATNVDVVRLQDFILDVALDTTSVDLIDAVKTKGYGFINGRGKITDSVTADKVDEMREYKDVDGNLYFPFVVLKVKCEKYDKERGLFKVEIEEYDNSDSGTMAETYNKEKTFYFDCTKQAVLTVDDIVSDKSALLSIVKKKALAIKDMCIMDELVNSINELPLGFEIEEKKLEFTFLKYEIACGAVGSIEIEVNSDEIESLLTPRGRQLMDVDDKATEKK